jgi:hypothetical protein
MSGDTERDERDERVAEQRVATGNGWVSERARLQNGSSDWSGEWMVNSTVGEIRYQQ